MAEKKNEKKTKKAAQPVEEEIKETGAQDTAEESIEQPQASPKAEELEKEVAKLKEQALRSLAEFDNFRKRTQKEKEGTYADAYVSCIGMFLPMLDNFERAAAVECSDETYKQGVEMILNQFKAILDKMEVTRVGKAGEPFDPAFHNAVMHVEDESLGESVIAEVFESGYVYKDRVVRHAMVKVAN